MTIEFKIVTKGKTLDKVVEEIESKEGKTLLGVTGGQDKSHCLAVALNNYGKDFRDSVKYYRVSNVKEHPDFGKYDMKVILEFYK